MKLTEVIRVWDILHMADTGELGYCDLERAIEDVVGVEDDVPHEQPRCLPDAGDLLESAWGLIANAYGSDWDLAQNRDWKPAAERWRDAYHKILPTLCREAEMPLEAVEVGDECRP